MFIEIVLWATIGNNGKHIYTLTPHDVQTFVKIFLTNEFTYSITSPTVKLSIVLFYRRLFPTRKFRIITNGIMVAVIAWGLAVFLAAALQCRPLHALWDPSVNGHCFDTLKYILGVQGVNIALDFAILILPMPQVWTLQRPWQDKFALSIVFLLGGFVCAASIYRIVTLLYIKNSDITYTIYLGTIWTFVEPCVGLVCGCLPTIRGLFPTLLIKRATKPQRRSKNTSLTLGGSAVSGSTSHTANVEYLKMDDARHSDLPDDTDNKGGANDADSRNHIRVNTTFEIV